MKVKKGNISQGCADRYTLKNASFKFTVFQTVWILLQQSNVRRNVHSKKSRQMIEQNCNKQWLKKVPSIMKQICFIPFEFKSVHNVHNVHSINQFPYIATYNKHTLQHTVIHLISPPPLFLISLLCPPSNQIELLMKKRDRSTLAVRWPWVWQGGIIWQFMCRVI